MKYFSRLKRVNNKDFAYKLLGEGDLAELEAGYMAVVVAGVLV